MQTRTVYTSGQGRICPDCSKPVDKCVCRRGKKKRKTPAAPPSKPDGIVRIGRSTKGRRGKGVTTVTGIPLAGDDLKEVAQTLKGKCGAGGTVKDGIIEIQGEHRETLQKALEAMGYTVKQSGG